MPPDGTRRLAHRRGIPDQRRQTGTNQPVTVFHDGHEQFGLAGINRPCLALLQADQRQGDTAQHQTRPDRAGPGLFCVYLL